MHARRHKDGMHYSCPAGFIGLKCEADVSHCRDNGRAAPGHFYLNGAPCKRRGGSGPDGASGLVGFGCKCDRGGEGRVGNGAPQAVAGWFYDYATTDYFTEGTAGRAFGLGGGYS